MTVFQLTVVSGPDKGLTFTFQSGEKFQIGRSRGFANRLSDPAVSRVHCEIKAEADRTLLYNLSRKGTLVNGASAQECVLQPGDLIGIGGTALRYVAEPADASTVTPAKPRPSLAALVGRTLAHFEIESVIARGHTGFVFRARDRDSKATVALKVLRPELSQNAEEQRRFVRAMKTMLPVRHPNLVRIHAAGRTKSYCWMAMEYVEGESLTQVIQRLGVAGALDCRHAYRVGVHIASALEHAHGLGILHRNVTPRNILIRNSDQSAVLSDLMLAKALEGTLAEQVTGPGTLLGDEAYLAPERTREGAEVDARADLYGLGATLYALVTGRPPFAARTPQRLIALVRSAAVVPPTTYQLCIPALFEGMVLRLLAKTPDERHSSARELLQDLKRIGKFAGLSSSAGANDASAQ
ncbi:MAG TPA: FHA domain-containing serine/threonine-protein kinase [Gemmataceae bacterium]|nr:FHA domain-containing serine/threonine-protein kinase [Gemmataceae bacterium]